MTKPTTDRDKSEAGVVVNPWLALILAALDWERRKKEKASQEAGTVEP